MPEQNLKNHSRYVPLYHFIIPIVLIWVLVHTIVMFANSSHDNVYGFSLDVALLLALLLMWFFLREFALKAQDRAIRAEENFRHFVMTGKPHDGRLGMRQVIALRFAGDDEFVALAKRAADENLSPKQIKQSITNWKADNNRA